ncbi:MAG: hypothetical protein OEV40_31415 [Acidimicrobiia bacterium]|nr:hypothetical protein [Acidimicrobiia bacterium]
MAPIRDLEVRLVTTNDPEAGGLGAAYVGLCGREFALNLGDTDLSRGASDAYRFGRDANVVAAEMNDPGSMLPLDTNDLGSYPIYVRFEPTASADTTMNTDWNVESVSIVINPGGAAQVTIPNRLLGPNHLWLGSAAGKTLFFPHPSGLDIFKQRLKVVQAALDLRARRARRATR